MFCGCGAVKVILHGEVEVGQRHNSSHLYRSSAAAAAAAAVKMRPSKSAGGGGPQRLMPPVALLLGILATTGVGGVPTSVLASAKDSGNVANHDDGGGGDGGSDSAPSIHQQSVTATDSLDGRNQISVPQKRGVNPLLYNDLEYSGNSIPHGGQWDDEGLFDQGPLSAAALYPGHPLEGAATRLRNYDLLASLLGPPPQPEQTFYDGPVTPAVSFPYGYGGGGDGGGRYRLDRNKRMATFGHGKNQRQQSLSTSRMKRSPGKLSAADALSLLAILDSRDPYPVAGPGSSLSDYFPSSSGSSANGPNDVLPYSPTNQDIPLSLALAQLLAERNNVGGGGGPLLSPYGDLIGNGGNVDDDGQWMNSWTEPGVDYLGFPMDVGAARMNGGYGLGKPSKIGFTPQKRFMVSKRKRSVGNSQHDHEENADCKSDKKTCLLRKVAAPA